jgi:hypothetical protein
LQDLDFKIEVFEVAGGAIESWSYITARLSSYIPFFKNVLPSFLYYFSSYVANIAYVEKKFKVLNELFPLSYFVVARKP